jgi:putative N6-adenine-specific DNA methylase
MDLFVTCAQTLEPLLVDELIGLGYPDVIMGFRGAHVKNVGMDAVYRINYLSRLGGRVLLPLSRFRCFDDNMLYAGVAKIDWAPYIPQNKSIAIDANVFHPHIRNSLFAAQVAKDAICDQFRERFDWRPDINVKNPDVQLNLYVNQDMAIMSIDTSGMPLHKRGYRQETVEAPMQESLAAALLVLAGYKGTEILCDPCCGSGTLLIEAALMASRTPPGFLRNRWGFMNLPQFSQDEWLQVKLKADDERIELPEHHFFGSDKNKQAVHACKVNLRAVGLHKAVEVVQCDVREYVPPVAPNFIITNPPYGKRLDDVQHLVSLYRAIGDFLKRQSTKPAKGFVFTGSRELSKEVGLAASRRHVVDNGGIDSRLLEFDLY